MRWAAFVGVVELPERFQTWGFRESLEGWNGAALLGAVVHDGYAGVEGVDQGGAGTLIPAMMRDDEDVHVAEFVVGHMSCISLSQVRSPRSRIFSLPKVISMPRERAFSV